MKPVFTLLTLAIVASGCTSTNTDCPTQPQSSLDRTTFPADGDTGVPTDSVIRVLDAQSAELIDLSDDSVVRSTETTLSSALGDVLELAPWTALESDAQYAVVADGREVARFTTSFGASVSTPGGSPNVSKRVDASFDCCGQTCEGGGTISVPWSGGRDTSSELVLLELERRVNGVCGATTQSFMTVGLVWPGDGDVELGGVFDATIDGCFLLTAHLMDGTRDDLGEACTEGRSFTPQPRPDTAECAPKSNGCSAAGSGDMGGGAMLLLLLLWGCRQGSGRAVGIPVPSPRR